MQEKETKAMYRLVLHNTVSKLSKGQTDLKRKYLINIAPVQVDITKSPQTSCFGLSQQFEWATSYQ